MRADIPENKGLTLNHATNATISNCATAVVLYEGDSYGGDFGLSFAQGLEAHGYQVEWAQREQPFPLEADVALAYGPFSRQSSMLPLAQRLRQTARDKRPIFVWWLTEGIPDRRLANFSIDPLARARLATDGVLLHWRNAPRWLYAGHRLRVFGELRALQTMGVLDVLAVTSASRADYLRAHGFQPIVVPLGYNLLYGRDLGRPRDIPAAFLGNTNAPRRAQILSRVVEELKMRGIAVEIQNDLYGDARTEFLNRTLILLNILRAPQDFVGQRFLLAAANKALVVSEPVKDHEPFVPNEHLVIAPQGKLADAVEHYLRHSAERTRIVENAYRLTTQELSIDKMVGRILDEAARVRAQA